MRAKDCDLPTSDDGQKASIEKLIGLGGVSCWLDGLRLTCEGADFHIPGVTVGPSYRDLIKDAYGVKFKLGLCILAFSRSQSAAMAELLSLAPEATDGQIARIFCDDPSRRQMVVNFGGTLVDQGFEQKPNMTSCTAFIESVFKGPHGGMGQTLRSAGDTRRCFTFNFAVWAPAFHSDFGNDVSKHIMQFELYSFRYRGEGSFGPIHKSFHATFDDAVFVKFWDTATVSQLCHDS